MITRDQLEELWRSAKDKIPLTLAKGIFGGIDYVRVTQFLINIYHRNLRLEYFRGNVLPKDSPKYIRETFINNTSYWDPNLYRNQYKERVAADILKDLVETEVFKDFLKSKLSPPKYLLNDQKGRTDKVIVEHNKMGKVFKSREETVWAVYEILYGTSSLEISSNSDDHNLYTVNLKNASDLVIKTTDNVKNAGIAGSVITALCNLDSLTIWEIYELTVNSDKERVLRLTTQQHALSIQRSYHAHDLPELRIKDLEDKIAVMTTDIQKMREMYDKYRGRFPETIPEAILGIVEHIFTFYTNYLSNPFPTKKFGFLNQLVKIVLEGYPTDKILTRLKKEMSKRYTL